MKETNGVGEARLHSQLEGILAKHGIRLRAKEGVVKMGEHVFGTALTDKDFQMFARSGIPRELAEHAARRVDSQTGAEMFGRNGFSGNFAGLIFDYR